MNATVCPTGTSPSAIAILSRTPAASASTSCVTLSVSSSNSGSPFSTGSPSDFSQLTIVPDSVVHSLIYDDAKNRVTGVRVIDANTKAAREYHARLVFLNRTCFNGLYRVNRHGEFNTPYGHYRNPTLVPEKSLRDASAALQHVTLTAAGYREACANAGPGDLVYLDPPYVPVGEHADFRRYHREQFRDDDHEELARLFKELDARGCHVRLSNAYTPFVLDLYADWTIHEVTTRRAINSNGSGRGPIREVVVAND